MTKQMKRLAGTLASLGVAATLVHPVPSNQNNEAETSKLDTNNKTVQLVQSTSKLKTTIDNKDTD